MAIFQSQLLNVIEWDEARSDVIFWKWANKEIKKGSRLIIRPGQDAIFIHNGRIEGVFTQDGSYEIETEIVPFLSTLKGFKFGFNSGFRAEVLFVNTKEFTESWGTKNAINIPSQSFPGGLPVRAFGTFNFKVQDYLTLIENIAGVKNTYAVEDVKERVLAVLNQYLMKWISREGKDMFNLQANSFEIGAGLQQDLDGEMKKIGFAVTGFNVSSFNYPEEVQKRINSVASAGMVGDIDHYQRVAMVDAIGQGGNNAAGASMQTAMGMAAGFNMANQMFGTQNQQNQQSRQTQQPPPQAQSANSSATSCTSCGAMINQNAKFCPECGAKRVVKTDKFCSECGAKIVGEAKFCSECGAKNA